MQRPKLIVLLNPDLKRHNESTNSMSDPSNPTEAPTNSDNLHNGSLISSSLYATSNSQALLGDVSPDQDLNSIISKLRAHHVDGQSQWRLYELLTAHPEDMALVPYSSHILVYNAMTTDLESEEDFNSWYNDEHIPLLSQTPSWLYSKRYALIACSDDAPRYLALHSWGSRAVFDSPAYKLATNTPWRTRVLERLVKRERVVFDYVDDVRVQEQAKTAVAAILAAVV